MSFLRILAGLGLIALALSYCGRWLAFGDSIAVGRLHLLLGGFLICALMWRRDRTVAQWLLVMMLVSAGQTYWLWRGPASGEAGDFVLYQKNMLFLNAQHPALIAELRDSGAQVITLQEVAKRNFPVLQALRDTYPNQHYCEFAGVGGVAILSRQPFVGGSTSCGDKDGLALAQVVVAGRGPVWFGSVHLHWPWPYGQKAQVERILPRLAELKGPVVIGGDFNMQPWGGSIARIAATLDDSRLGYYGATFSRFWTFAPLMIDHVLLPRGVTGAVERRGFVGSDHMGLRASLKF